MARRVRLLLAVAAGLLALGALGAVPAQAVVGGRPARADEGRWMVALVDRDSRRRPIDGQFCGGALVGPRTVVTAAHCLVFGGRPLVVRRRVLPTLGRAADLAEVAEVVVHPGFRPEFDEESQLGDPNDLGLVRLKRPLPGPYLRISGATPDASAWDPGRELRIFGWGNRSRTGPNLPRQLHTGTIERFTDAACDDRYGRGFDAGTMFCGGRADGAVDTCEGDSGGPVVGVDRAGRDVLVGIVSFGHECGLAEWPGVYTRIPSYSAWLSSRPRPRARSGSRERD
jgi:secreted trypsin-like serine protease